MAKPVTHTLDLPTPHSWQQRSMMQAFLTPGLAEMWCACGSKFGKSLGAAAGMVGAAWVKPDRLYRWVAPVYRQAKIGMKYHKRLLPESKIHIDKSEPSLTIRDMNTTIEYVSAKHPEDMEGEGVDGGYGLDEAAKMQRQAYDSAKTTVTFTRAPIVAFSTPKGKGWFFEKCMDARARMEFDLAKGNAPTHIYLHAPATANPGIHPSQFEELRRSLPDRLYKQYVEAEFVDDGSVFLGFRDGVIGDVVEFDIENHIQTWVMLEAGTHNVVIGVDWAKKHDFVVFTAISLDADTPRLIGYERFQGLSYIESIKRLIRFGKRFRLVSLVRHDKTGVGEVIDDMLAGTNLPFEGIVFTNQSKNSMVTRLMLSFEQRDLDIPYIPELLYELDMFEVIPTAAGNFRYSAPVGMHDDIVCSLMLANEAVCEMRSGFEIRALEDLPGTTLTTDRFYEELMHDDDD